MTRVIWLNFHTDECDSPGMWDQQLLMSYFDRLGWVGPSDDLGAVVVIPGRFHVHDVADINLILSELDWALVIVTSDEESLFPTHELRHPAMRIWQMTPLPASPLPSVPVRYIGEGFRVLASAWVAVAQRKPTERPLDWFFAGQITHERRRVMASALQAIEDRFVGYLFPTAGFTQGLSPELYYRNMASAAVIPCPSGPATPDSFRLYEALEAGCVPLADRYCPAYPDGGFWDLVAPDAPFPIVDNWADVGHHVGQALAGGQHLRNQCFAWWQLHKRQHQIDLRTDVVALGGTVKPMHPITVLMPTSPSPLHPDASIIEDTIASVQARLPESEILVVADGVRPEQEHRRDAYEEYVAHLLWRTNFDPTWSNVGVIVADQWLHQANLTRLGLSYVQTPQMLFVEHDTPLCERIPFDALSELIRVDAAKVIRFHHEALILPSHEHLMLDREPVQVGSVEVTRTVQWSQRPHLASTDFYRHIIERYFGTKSRTMIEDTMHGVVQEAWRTYGVAGWEQFGLWMYTPSGDFKRSLHSDGRRNDPKFEMYYDYDGPTPGGAPAPTKGRVD